MGGVNSRFLLARAMSVRTYQANLESSYFCWPRLCLGGPTESTWNLHFASQGFAWEGLPNQPGIHTVLPARALPRRPYRINLESTAAPHFAYLQWWGDGGHVGRRAPHTMLCRWSWMSLDPGPVPPTLPVKLLTGQSGNRDFL